MEFKSKYEIENEINQEISELKTLDNIYIKLFGILKDYDNIYLTTSIGEKIANKLYSLFASIQVYFSFNNSKDSLLEIIVNGEHCIFIFPGEKFNYEKFVSSQKLKIEYIKRELLNLENFMFKINGKSKFDFYYEKYNELMTGFYSLHAGLKDFNTLNFFDMPYINDLN